MAIARTFTTLLLAASLGLAVGTAPQAAAVPDRAEKANDDGRTVRIGDVFQTKPKDGVITDGVIYCPGDPKCP